MVHLGYFTGGQVVTDLGSGGVLEWCRSRPDAQETLDKMKLTEEFADLKLSAWEMEES
jgi:hypothetical protein